MTLKLLHSVAFPSFRSFCSVPICPAGISTRRPALLSFLMHSAWGEFNVWYLYEMLFYLWKLKNHKIHYIWLGSLNFFKRFYLFIFRERGREGDREGEKHQCVVATHMAPTGDLACNPGMCPDWKLNGRPFGSQSLLVPLSYTSRGEFFFTVFLLWTPSCTLHLLPVMTWID